MFASWLLTFLMIVVFAVVSQFNIVPVNAILIGCIFAYLMIFIGRLTGGIKYPNVLYIPVLVGIGAAIAMPLLKYANPYIQPRGEVAVKYLPQHMAEEDIVETNNSLEERRVYLEKAQKKREGRQSRDFAASADSFDDNVKSIEDAHGQAQDAVNEQ